MNDPELQIDETEGTRSPSQPLTLHKEGIAMPALPPQGIYMHPINELATALSKAQATVEGASKDATNPHFKSKYSDLSACWNACRKALSDNGLAVIQIPRTEGSMVTVRTILTHSSGQFIEGELSVQNQNQKNMAQGIGSCITYLRRYALCSFVGISPEEDDGEAAASQQTNSYTSRPAYQAKEKTGPSNPQLKRLFALVGESKWTPDQMKEIMKDKFNIESSRDLTQEQYNQICTALENNPKLVQKKEDSKETDPGKTEPKTVEQMKADGQVKPASEV